MSDGAAEGGGLNPYMVMFTPDSPLELICTVCLCRWSQSEVAAKRCLTKLRSGRRGGALKYQDVAAGFAPVAGDAVALAGHIVSGRTCSCGCGMQALRQAQSGTVDL